MISDFTPELKRLLHDDAKVCRYCQREIPEEKTPIVDPKKAVGTYPSRDVWFAMGRSDKQLIVWNMMVAVGDGGQRPRFNEAHYVTISM